MKSKKMERSLLLLRSKKLITLMLAGVMMFIFSFTGEIFESATVPAIKVYNVIEAD